MTASTWRGFQDWRGGTHRYRFRILLATLLAMLAAAPLTVGDSARDPLFALSFSLVILAGLLAMKRERILLLLAVLLGVPAIIARWVSVLVPEQTAILFDALFPIFFLSFFVVFLLRAVITADRVTTDTIAGALSVYLLLGFVWSLAYQGLTLVDPAAFHIGSAIADTGPLDRVDFVYYSFITLATVGYGDITPVTPLAQSFAYAEAVTGVLYVAVLVARLVSAYRR